MITNIPSIPELPKLTLDRRHLTPDKPTPIKLSGDYVYLEPLTLKKFFLQCLTAAQSL